MARKWEKRADGSAVEDEFSLRSRANCTIVRTQQTLSNEKWPMKCTFSQYIWRISLLSLSCSSVAIKVATYAREKWEKITLGRRTVEGHTRRNETAETKITTAKQMRKEIDKKRNTSFLCGHNCDRFNVAMRLSSDPRFAVNSFPFAVRRLGKVLQHSADAWMCARVMCTIKP